LKRLQVWFWNESGFSLRVIRRKRWGKKGKRESVKQLEEFLSKLLNKGGFIIK
jgi:hypothetical protein